MTLLLGTSVQSLKGLVLIPSMHFPDDGKSCTYPNAFMYFINIEDIFLKPDIKPTGSHRFFFFEVMPVLMWDSVNTMKEKSVERSHRNKNSRIREIPVRKG